MIIEDVNSIKNMDFFCVCTSIVSRNRKRMFRICLCDFFTVRLRNFHDKQESVCVHCFNGVIELSHSKVSGSMTNRCGIPGPSPSMETYGGSWGKSQMFN